MKRFLCFLAVALVTTGAAGQSAQYPSRPVTIVNPWNAGGVIDVVARATAQSMQKQTGNPFIIENVPGAGSMIGTTRVANAKPDGYTLLWGTSSGLVILPHINSNVRYHPMKSFEPISWVGTSPYFIVVSVTSPHRTIRDLLAYAKANPGKLSYGTPGTGSSPHVTAQAILSATQTTMLHVPFKSGRDMINAVLRGDADWSMDLSNGVLPLAKAGRLRLLAVTSAKRMPSAPDVPAVQEEPGLAGFESLSWIGVFAPKGISAEQVSVVNRLVANALQDPEVVAVLASGGFTAAPSTPAQLAETVKREYEQWGAVIQRHNIRVD